MLTAKCDGKYTQHAWCTQSLKHEPDINWPVRSDVQRRGLSLIIWTEPLSVLGGGVPFDVCSVLPLLRASHLQSVPGADPGICIRGPCPTPLSSLLEVGSPLKLGSVGSAVSSYSGVRCGVPAENEFKHSKAVRNPLVAIISSILKCMFYSCHLSGVPWRDGVGPSPKGGWGRADSESATVYGGMWTIEIIIMFYYAIMAARHTVQYTHIQSYTQIHPLKNKKILKTVKNGKKEQNW